MLSFIRRALTSWVMLALLGILIVAFVITGIGDPFGGGGPAPGTLAKVGREAVTEAEFGQVFDRFMTQARENNPTLTNEQAARQGAVDQVLNQLVAAEALKQFGAKQGITISDRFIDGQIASVPAFQRGGQFSQEAYEAALAAQRLSPRELRDGLRDDAIRNQLLQNMIGGAFVPQSLVEPYAALLLERRVGSVGAIPVERITGVTAPTRAQVQSYYEANLRRYTIPERRPFRYALLSRADLKQRAQVSDADVAKYYDEHRVEYGGVETRRLAQVVVPDQAVATRIAARVRGGETFEKVAAELAGYSAADLDVGQQTRERFAQSTSAAVAEAAFALPASGVSNPVRSDFGWHVVRATSVQAAAPRSLASVRGEIVEKLRAERAEDALSDAVAAAEDAFDDGQSFADVVKARGLTVVDVPPVTVDGRVVNATFQLEPRLAKLLGAAFEPDATEQPTVQEIDRDTFALLDVGDPVAARPIPLGEIRQAVATDWGRDERLKRARAAAEAIVKEVSAGSTLAAALAKRGLPAAQTIQGRRIDAAQAARQGGRVPAPVALMFTLPRNGVRAVPAPQGRGFFIVKVERTEPADPSAIPGLVQGTRAEIAQSAADEAAAQFARAVQDGVGVERNEAAITRVRQRLLGQGEPAAQ
jgi:parvulin-like peptidyl-prolyl isomerase